MHKRRMNMALIIGLTGSIGTGKSTVSEMFKQLQIPVVDADIIARRVVEPNEPTYKKIIETFGESILHDDRTLNRQALGKIVFNDQQKRQQLNEIIHPAIRQEMLRQRDHHITNGEKCVVLDIPLLFESKLTHFIDKIIVVATDEKIQLERVIARDQSTKEEALQRIKTQIPITQKTKLADAVINNNGTIEETRKQLIKILTDWHVL